MALEGESGPIGESTVRRAVSIEDLVLEIGRQSERGCGSPRGEAQCPHRQVPGVQDRATKAAFGRQFASESRPQPGAWTSLPTVTLSGHVDRLRCGGVPFGEPFGIEARARGEVPPVAGRPIVVERQILDTFGADESGEASVEQVVSKDVVGIVVIA